MAYYAIVMQDDHISHHGVKGQKWGVRRYQNLDGTWKNAKKKKSSKKKPLTEAQKKARRAKIAAGVAIGAGVALAGVAAWRAIKRGESNAAAKSGYTLKKGDTLYRTTGTKEVHEMDRPFYATPSTRDANEYKGFYGFTEKMRGHKDVYSKEFLIKNNIRVAGKDQAAPVMKELMDSDPSFKITAQRYADRYLQSNKFPGGQVLNGKQKKALRDLASGKDPYAGMNWLLVTHEPDLQSNVHNKLFEALKQKGFSGMIDDNDQRMSGYKSSFPTIMFDHKAIGLKSVSKIATGELIRAASVEAGKKALIPLLGITAGIAGISALKNFIQSKKTKNKEEKK